jgi:hypothetical protein
LIALISLIRDRRWEGPFPLTGDDLREVWQAVSHAYPPAPQVQAILLMEAADPDRGWMWDHWVHQPAERRAAVLAYLRPSRIPAVVDQGWLLLESPSPRVRIDAVHALAAWEADLDPDHRSRRNAQWWRMLHHDPDRAVRLTVGWYLTRMKVVWVRELAPLVDTLHAALDTTDRYEQTIVAALLADAVDHGDDRVLLPLIDHPIATCHVWSQSAMLHRRHAAVFGVTRGVLAGGTPAQRSQWAAWVWDVCRYETGRGPIAPAWLALIGHEWLASALCAYGRTMIEQDPQDVWRSSSLRIIGKRCPSLVDVMLERIESVLRESGSPLPAWIVDAVDAVWQTDAHGRTLPLIKRFHDRFPDDMLMQILRRGVASSDARAVCGWIRDRCPTHADAVMHIVRGICETSSTHDDSPLPDGMIPWILQAIDIAPHAITDTILRRVWRTDPLAAQSITGRLLASNDPRGRWEAIMALPAAWGCGDDRVIVACIRMTMPHVLRRPSEHDGIIQAIASGLARATPTVIPDLVNLWQVMMARASSRSRKRALLAGIASAWKHGCDTTVLQALTPLVDSPDPQILEGVVAALRAGWGGSCDRDIAQQIARLIRHAQAAGDRAYRDTVRDSYARVMALAIQAMADGWTGDGGDICASILADLVMHWRTAHDGMEIRRYLGIGDAIIRSLLAGQPVLGTETVCRYVHDLMTDDPYPVIRWLSSAVSSRSASIRAS